MTLTLMNMLNKGGQKPILYVSFINFRILDARSNCSFPLYAEPSQGTMRLLIPVHTNILLLTSHR